MKTIIRTYTRPSKLSNNLHKVKLKSDFEQQRKDIEGLYEAYRSHIKTANYEVIHKEMLSTFLNTSNQTAEKILVKASERLEKKHAPIFYLNKNMDLYKLYGISFAYDDVALAKVFSMIPTHTETRLGMMKEVGLPMTAENINRLPFISRVKVKHLENMNLIHPQNLVKKIFEQLRAPESVITSLPEPRKYRQWTLKELWRQLFSILLKWKFSLDTYPNYIFNSKVYISLDSVCNNINILKKHLHFTDRKILSYLAIITSSTSNLMTFRKDTDPEIQRFISLRPDIIIRPYDDIKISHAMLRYIKGGPLTESGFVQIFLMTSYELLRRLEILISTTSLTDLRLTPRCYILIYRMKYFLEKFKEEKMNLESMDCFPCLNLILRKEGQSVNSVKVVCTFLKEVLQIPVSRKEINQMNMIEFPETSCIKKNLIFLLNEGFPLENVKRAYQVLLFSNEVLLENYGNMHSCPFAQEFWEKNDYDKLIQLLIYYANRYYMELGVAV